PAVAKNAPSATSPKRGERRAETDGRVATVFGATDVAPLIERLAAADIAFARVSDMAALGRHPHLRRIKVGLRSGAVAYPAPAIKRAGESRPYGPVPALGEHTAKVRGEFLAAEATAR